MSSAEELKADYQQLWQTVLQEHKQVFAELDLKELEGLMEDICAAHAVFVYGAGREGIAARSFAMRLMHLGKEVHWLWDDTTPGMHKGDLFLVVNGSGAINHIKCLMANARATGARVLAVTGSPSGDAMSLADGQLFVHAAVYKGKDKVVPSVQPMGNLFEQHLFLLFDIIVMLLSRRLNLSSAQMEARHRNIE